jgi:hypothetical protein
MKLFASLFTAAVMAAAPVASSEQVRKWIDYILMAQCIRVIY